jgi:hypothetical protein
LKQFLMGQKFNFSKLRTIRSSSKSTIIDQLSLSLEIHHG